MGRRKKTRLIVLGSIIVVAMVASVSIVCSITSAKSVSVAQALDASLQGQKIKVSGNVVPGSFTFDTAVLSFCIYDPEGDASVELPVEYDKGVSATFGSEVTAICTGVVDDDGVLKCSELITKCPSKYENSTDALSVGQLLGYGEQLYGKTLKVKGLIQVSSLKMTTGDIRFVLSDAEKQETSVSVCCPAALTEAIAEGDVVVLTGSLDRDKIFSAAAVKLAE